MCQNIKNDVCFKKEAKNIEYRAWNKRVFFFPSKVVKWQFSNVTWVKINFNRATRGNTDLAGAGSVILDHKSKILGLLGRKVMMPLVYFPLMSIRYGCMSRLQGDNCACKERTFNMFIV